MAYMSSYNNVTDFASYLHNPYNFCNDKQRAAIMVFKRRARFVEGYDIYNDLRELLMTFFGNNTELIKYGLKKHYNDLKTHVEDNNLIGLILYGANINNLVGKEQYISTYVTTSNTRIKLKMSEICQFLLKEYFKDDENYINELCEKTPNFEIYYSHTISEKEYRNI
jgi:hypothetical protein